MFNSASNYYDYERCPLYVGPGHHGMACPHFAVGGTASSYGG
jgi:hypothetical protein